MVDRIETQTDRAGGPQWTEVLYEIRLSEKKVRADIAGVKLDVADLSARVGTIETARCLEEQRTRDWFLAGSMVRTLIVTALALGGFVLGVLHAI